MSEIEPCPELVEAQAEIVYQAKLLLKIRRKITLFAREVEDEGDRVYFRSTNDADALRDLAEDLDEFEWSRMEKNAKGRDLYQKMRNLNDTVRKLGAEIGAIAASRDRASDACATVQRERDEAREEVERLRKLVAPQWFYYGDECSSDRCRDSIHECIDEDFLYDNRGEGSHVLEIATATNLPTIWAVVHFFTDEEKDARQSDDDYEVAEFATEAEAEAFLAHYEASK